MAITSQRARQVVAATAPQVVHVTASGAKAGQGQVLAVPGADVALLPIEVPDKLRGQNRENVAHRQLRDKFDIDPDAVDLRPFSGTKGSDEWSRVLVTDKALLARWRDAVAEDALAILPDYLTLPTAPDIWTVATGVDGIAARLGPDDGFGAHVDLAIVLLNKALDARDTPPKAILRLGEPVPEIDAIAAERSIPIVTDVAAAGAKTLGYGETACDLRQDPRLARARMAARILPWRWPIAFGLVATIVWGAAEWVVTKRILDETHAIQAQTTALVQEHFVDGAPVVDARVQVTRALATAQAQAQGAGAQPEPLTLFAQAALVLDAAGARTETASFSATDGLRLVTAMNDFAAVETLVEDLEAAGLAVNVQDTRASDAGPGVQATLALTQSTDGPEGENR
ncbi:type II secretion system protein GspL [Tateyamaria sp. syn59]|uniref:type II secretion system protein GspL n=1 Tax=Tateyamaria sp. syn59 TaxID=2576942 RepID=UPI0011BD85EB|nr:type II secretion system protein GspL [Tateyamaria sp. syn59]